RPEIRVSARLRCGVSCIVLRYRLHRPFDRVAGHVLHGNVELNAGRIGVDSDGAGELNARLWISWAREFDLASLALRKDSKREWPIVQNVGISNPVLFVVVAFRQEPDFVAAVIKPLLGSWRQILACILRIHEQEGMTGELNLHQAPAVLRYGRELDPLIR